MNPGRSRELLSRETEEKYWMRVSLLGCGSAVLLFGVGLIAGAGDDGFKTWVAVQRFQVGVGTHEQGGVDR